MARTPHAEKAKIEVQGATVYMYVFTKEDDTRGYAWFGTLKDETSDSRIRRAINGPFEVKPGLTDMGVPCDVYMLAHLADYEPKHVPKQNDYATSLLRYHHASVMNQFRAPPQVLVAAVYSIPPVLGPIVVRFKQTGWRRMTIRHETGVNPFERLHDTEYVSETIEVPGARTSYFYFNRPEEEPTFSIMMRLA